LLLAAPPWPSLDAGPQRDGPVFSSEVALVLLPVFVVGPDGKAVRGLSADDFELSEDGKRVPVVAFRFVDRTSPARHVHIDTRAGRCFQDPGTQLDVGGLATVLVNQMRAGEIEAYRGYIAGLIANMDELAKSLRHLEGRKQVLYFSAGFDSRLLIGQTGEE